MDFDAAALSLELRQIMGCISWSTWKKEM